MNGVLNRPLVSCQIPSGLLGKSFVRLQLFFLDIGDGPASSSRGDETVPKPFAGLKEIRQQIDGRLDGESPLDVAQAETSLRRLPLDIRHFVHWGNEGQLDV